MTVVMDWFLSVWIIGYVEFHLVWGIVECCLDFIVLLLFRSFFRYDLTLPLWGTSPLLFLLSDSACSLNLLVNSFAMIWKTGAISLHVEILLTFKSSLFILVWRLKSFQWSWRLTFGFPLASVTDASSSLYRNCLEVPLIRDLVFFECPYWRDILGRCLSLSY